MSVLSQLSIQNKFYRSSHPQLVSSMDPSTCSDAIPKSATRMLFFSSSNRFSGFKSRWLKHMVIKYTCTYDVIEVCSSPDGVTVAEVEGWYDLSEELSRFFRRQSTFFDEVVEQLATTHVLQHQVPACSMTSSHFVDLSWPITTLATTNN